LRDRVVEYLGFEQRPLAVVGVASERIGHASILALHAANRLARMTRRRVFQTSLMSALLAGVYEGDLTVGELLTHGNVGLGTFDALDGEMIVLDGQCLRMRSDGSVTQVDNAEVTPFAVVVDFVTDHLIQVDEPTDMARLFELVGADSDNYLYAVRVIGHFDSVTTRTVAKQSKPYLPLKEAVMGQAYMEFADLHGELIGFESPLYEKGIGIPGGHVHFVTDDRTRGGHVLDFVMTSGTIEVCVGTDLDLRLPLRREFSSAMLSPDDIDEQIEATENQRH
jgi:acetolactate decarboxylase